MTAGLAYSGKAPALDTNAIPILSADDRLLILKHKGSAQRIDCYLDVSDPVLTQRPEYPLLIFSLINQVTGQNLDSAPLTVTRDGNASRIAPLTLPELSTSPLKTQITQTSFTPVLLFAALLVLLLDASLATGLLNKTREQHK